MWAAIDRRDAALLAAGAAAGAAVAFAVRPLVSRALRTSKTAWPIQRQRCNGGSATRREQHVESAASHSSCESNNNNTEPAEHPGTHSRDAGGSARSSGCGRALRLANSPVRVAQSVLEHGRGDALRACVASLFALDLADVPDLLADPEGYDAAIAKYVCCSATRITRPHTQEHVHCQLPCFARL
jgi:hypothetical protein